MSEAANARSHWAARASDELPAFVLDAEPRLRGVQSNPVFRMMLYRRRRRGAVEIAGSGFLRAIGVGFVIVGGLLLPVAAIAVILIAPVFLAAAVLPLALLILIVTTLAGVFAALGRTRPGRRAGGPIDKMASTLIGPARRRRAASTSAFLPPSILRELDHCGFTAAGIADGLWGCGVRRGAIRRRLVAAALILGGSWALLFAIPMLTAAGSLYPVLLMTLGITGCFNAAARIAIVRESPFDTLKRVSETMAHLAGASCASWTRAEAGFRLRRFAFACAWFGFAMTLGAIGAIILREFASNALGISVAAQSALAGVIATAFGAYWGVSQGRLYRELAPIHRDELNRCVRKLVAAAREGRDDRAGES